MYKNSFFFLCFFMFAFGFSQSDLNAYKYVIVPNKYDFLKEADQYQLNSLSEFLFNKYGFVALKEFTEIPNDLKNDRCLALTSNVVNEKHVLRTRLSIILKDCNNKEVYKSKVGESREKEFKVAYNKALRAAFKSISSLNHNYQEDESSKSILTAKALTNTKIDKVEPIITPNKITKNKSNQPLEPTSVLHTLYAQTVDNGFQLVDSTPKVIYKLLNTSVNNVFLVEGREALIYKSSTNWVLEFYENGNLKHKILTIK